MSVNKMFVPKFRECNEQKYCYNKEYKRLLGVIAQGEKLASLCKGKNYKNCGY